ncbi:hypothetical protein [Polyangium sp. y55x31]|uniref:hypothetical protein n=1 Tax=Polyangium sp. y55x31 TaxID=3042688 RepID=UPI002482DB6A|nr:hypothetical protein [Polyangium sp. y55x31]MDI1475453.1 hypothetical protein [Polyangium sp. y55x31]
MKPPRPPRRPPSQTPSPRGSSGRPAPPEDPDAEEIRALVANVKDKLVQADDFGHVMDAFFEQLGTNLRFLTKGVRIDERPLLGALVPLAEQMATRPLHVTEMKLVRLHEHHMMHGMLYFVGWLGVVLLFEDIGMGILALSEADLRGPTLYGRFRFAATERPARPLN